jgi:hypothetical protein
VTTSTGLVKCWAVSDLPVSPEDALQRLSPVKAAPTTAAPAPPAPSLPTGGVHEEKTGGLPAAEEEEDLVPRAWPPPMATACPLMGRHPAPQPQPQAPPPTVPAPFPVSAPAVNAGAGEARGPGAVDAAEQQGRKRAAAAAAREEEEEQQEDLEPRRMPPPPPTPLEAPRQPPVGVGDLSSSGPGLLSSTGLRTVQFRPPEPPAAEAGEAGTESPAGAVVLDAAPLPPVTLLPSLLGAPAVNSCRYLRDELVRLQEQRFDPRTIDPDTSSVLEEAARVRDVKADECPSSSPDSSCRGEKVVDFAPGERLFPDLTPVDAKPPPPRVIKKQVRGEEDSSYSPVSRLLIAWQVDPAWVAKQALRPSAQDFLTPDLELRVPLTIVARPPPAPCAPTADLRTTAGAATLRSLLASLENPSFDAAGRMYSTVFSR